MFTEKILNSIEESILCWLATASADGKPNVSPKEIFVPFSEKHLLIANIASPISVKNIKENPNVCVSFIEIFKQKGYKLNGFAKIIGEGSECYTEKINLLKQLAGERFPIKEIIEIEATTISPIVAPSYWLYPAKTTEESQINQSLKTYGITK